MQRKDHWDTQHFDDFLLARVTMEFAWGTNDCALFAADAVEAITGVDIAEDFRGKYTTEKKAFALIASLTGGTTVADAASYCAAKHGLVEHEFPLMAKRGDLVVVEDDSRLIAGVVHLSGRHVVVVGEGGLKRVPLTAIKRAWAI